MKTVRNKDGRFQRKFEVWTPEKWDEGYIDNRGRMRVYRPDYPRAYSEGYALRAHVVYWLHYGKPHPVGTELHHKDGTKNNDVIENLIALTNSDHQSLHRENWVYIICEHCGKEFKEHTWRVRQRDVKFCSPACFQEHPRTEEHKKSISDGLKRSHKERNIYQKSLVSVICKHCGKEFKKPASIVRSQRSIHFCSRDCYYKHPRPKR